MIVAGDFNSPLNYFDPTTLVMKLLNGYQDAHSSMSYFDRNTAPTDTLSKFGLWTFDYIFNKNSEILE